MIKTACNFLPRRLMTVCAVLIGIAAQSAKAQVLWSRQEGPWQVTLFRGERGDAWCSWTVGGQPGLGGSQRSMSLQIRGEEVVLFLFMGELPLSRWQPSALVTFSFGDREHVIELDQVRLLANGFSMSRGIVAQGVEAMARFTSGLVNASAVSLMLPNGVTWVMDTTGLDATAPLMQRCLREAANMGASEPAR